MVEGTDAVVVVAPTGGVGDDVIEENDDRMDMADGDAIVGVVGVTAAGTSEEAEAVVKKDVDRSGETDTSDASEIISERGMERSYVMWNKEAMELVVPEVRIVEGPLFTFEAEGERTGSGTPGCDLAQKQALGSDCWQQYCAGSGKGTKGGGPDCQQAPRPREPPVQNCMAQSVDAIQFNR